ncbi:MULTISPECIES: EscU/YscU/HrcU family type III secretion system export apparatus switch protein [unclassified Paenibacillus]|uniref:EscU/YscU/HrcU family type III secretion system export apparatus switch protein n=1 Tax=unclassified Paenibacillus TaxID=185978 RepID=UPI0024075B6E|nr:MULTISPECIES: EscU/YscU/HrcU family type III secretion system export apparatus switch protein [unclassified Paenibacillus]MDF9841404.1 flagellar biosynthesis protein [Paenibacillus sp. PastF-2]MDF9847995.1 flagellar biosynthesis protein [Paenibacillus sp. PastM-2]MDF9854563.1 flagellar biosynthesis protein [Paenibacillus sp. PastF-1]MDH6479828.1 flagellar biosynthesis protein [Paenibacillus sp. PastH-2]MDH6507270.1 flagellar biosynthesis protein [Paenibacillus sp. PastM-3]
MSEQEKQEVSQRMKRAVALKYTPGQSEAPVVVAKGQGAVADMILQKAKENGVAVQEDAALVEVLSKLDLDQQIPPELYNLVAEILSFVYQSDKLAGKRKIQ